MNKGINLDLALAVHRAGGFACLTSYCYYDNLKPRLNEFVLDVYKFVKLAHSPDLDDREALQLLRRAEEFFVDAEVDGEGDTGCPGEAADPGGTDGGVELGGAGGDPGRGDPVAVELDRRLDRTLGVLDAHHHLPGDRTRRQPRSRSRTRSITTRTASKWVSLAPARSPGPSIPT